MLMFFHSEKKMCGVCKSYWYKLPGCLASGLQNKGFCQELLMKFSTNQENQLFQPWATCTNESRFLKLFDITKNRILQYTLK